MKRLSTLLCGALLLILSMAVHAERYKLSGAGASVASEAADTNGDMEGGAVSTSTVSGSGVTMISGRSDLLPWDGFSFCLFDPDTGFPSGVLLSYASITNVDLFANGDALYRVMDQSGPQSTLCFNFVDNQSFTFEFHYVVTGGTGRYANATGNAVATGSGTVVAPGHSAFAVELEGTINR